MLGGHPHRRRGLCRWQRVRPLMMPGKTCSFRFAAFISPDRSLPGRRRPGADLTLFNRVARRYPGLIHRLSFVYLYVWMSVIFPSSIIILPHNADEIIYDLPLVPSHINDMLCSRRSLIPEASLSHNSMTRCIESISKYRSRVTLNSVYFSFKVACGALPGCDQFI